MRLTTTTAAGLSAAFACMAAPAVAMAHPSTAGSGGIATAVEQVRAHTDRADAALDRAVVLFGRDRDRSAKVAFARSRREMGRARADAARARRQADTVGELVDAAHSQALLAAQQDENIEALVSVLRPADGRDENAVAAAARADTRGREKAIAILNVLLGQVPEQARAGIAIAIAKLSLDREGEVTALSRALTSSQVSRANKRRVASAMRVSVEGQAKAAAKLAALIADPNMPAASKRGLQIALAAVTAEHGSVADILSRFSSRMPSFVRPFVEQIITQARTDARGMRENHPTGPPAGVPGGGAPSGVTPGGPPSGIAPGPPAGVRPGPPAATPMS